MQNSLKVVVRFWAEPLNIITIFVSGFDDKALIYRIPVKKRTNSRFGLTNYSSFCVKSSTHPHFSRPFPRCYFFAHHSRLERFSLLGKRDRSKEKRVHTTVNLVVMTFGRRSKIIHTLNNSC